MNTQTIQAEARADAGKGVARKLRASGLIPAVAYGGAGDAVQLSLDPRDLTNLRKAPLGWNSPIEIEVEGGENVGLVLLRAVQKHPISGKLLHADFLRVAADSEVEVKVPLRLTGSSPGAALGGRLSQPKREVAVLCTPASIPNGVEIDVSSLNIGDRIMLSEVAFPEGVRASFKHDAPAVACVGRRGAREAATSDDGAGDEAGAEANAE